METTIAATVIIPPATLLAMVLAPVIGGAQDEGPLFEGLPEPSLQIQGEESQPHAKDHDRGRYREQTLAET